MAEALVAGRAEEVRPQCCILNGREMIVADSRSERLKYSSGRRGTHQMTAKSGRGECQNRAMLFETRMVYFVSAADSSDRR